MSAITVMVPGFMAGDSGSFGRRISLLATGLGEMREALRSLDVLFAEKLWDPHGEVRKNVVVVWNGEIVPRKGYSGLMFRDGDEVEFLVQFAGG